jgi:hypothetical protein
LLDVKVHKCKNTGTGFLLGKCMKYFDSS